MSEPIEDEMDIELVVMGKVNTAMALVDEETRARIYDWVGRKWGLDTPPSNVTPGNQVTNRPPVSSQVEPATDDSTDFGAQVGGYSTFAELCTDASPKTDADKALVGGYWLQVICGKETFASQECNDALKNYGEPISNITRAFTKLKLDKLVMQVEKSGKTQQARKKLKLTHKGISAVESMLNG